MRNLTQRNNQNRIKSQFKRYSSYPMKSFRLYNPQIPIEEKIIKYLGLFAILLLVTPFGGFAVMVFPISLVILMPLFSIIFSKYILKNKIIRNVIILIDIAIIAVAFYIDIYFYLTGGNIIGL